MFHDSLQSRMTATIEWIFAHNSIPSNTHTHTLLFLLPTGKPKYYYTIISCVCSCLSPWQCYVTPHPTPALGIVTTEYWLSGWEIVAGWERGIKRLADLWPCPKTHMRMEKDIVVTMDVRNWNGLNSFRASECSRIQSVRRRIECIQHQGQQTLPWSTC
jgi:hypothetical protein